MQKQMQREIFHHGCRVYCLATSSEIQVPKNLLVLFINIAVLELLELSQTKE